MNLFENTYIILYRPEKIRNIGQTARAIKNFGFTNLRIVSPPAGNMREAYENAVNARDIIDNREIYNSIEDATGDLNILIGTTSRTSELPMSPAGLAEFMLNRPNLKYGILFGTEFRGLSNSEISLCHKVVSIPTSELYPSMNLSHAVCVICYELRKAFVSNEHINYIHREPVATISEIENLLKHAGETLKNIGFLREGSPGHLITILRRLSINTELTSKDIRILRGILRQIDWVYEKNSGIKRGS